ncbi:MAG: transposase domain-containing protein [[Pasteurella] aerogenes]|nr:transposase domain-containing protein [[Pasteurella] aerogenes]
MSELGTYYSAQQLVDLNLNSLPKTKKAILTRANKEKWDWRVRQGKGGGYEYAFKSLPEEIQAEILLKTHRTLPTVVEAAKPEKAPVAAQQLWAEWEQANERNQAMALVKHGAVTAVAELVAHNVKLLNAIDVVVGKINLKAENEGGKGVSVGSVKRWYYQVKDADRGVWLPLLLENHGKNRTACEAEFTPTAWEFFKSDYLRAEKPQFGSCYERLKRAAAHNGWKVPSVSSVKRKLNREIGLSGIMVLRDGDYAASRLYPTLKRSVAHINAMQWINGDGYQHNVWVEWHNGEIKRPKTWIWQDLRTRMILAYRTDLSENTDMIRLALLDVVSKYGIPEHITIDNTRAAANKTMTGGVKNRYRFKVQEDEVQGIIPALGIQLHWTSIQFGKGRGQAKPIERAFSHGGLGELVDLHPSLAGYFTGRNAYSKPEYEEKPQGGVAYATFILALEEGIQMFNERLKRETEICQGELSFKQAFERDYQLTTVRKPTPEQMRLLLTLHEEVTLKADGTFTLKAGGKVNGLQNTYSAYELIGTHYKQVVVRFDPNDLQNKVWVYTRDGRFLAEAQCQQATAFDNTQAAREHNRKMREFVRHTKKAAKAQLSISIQEAATYLPDVEIEDAELEESTEKVAFNWANLVDGNTVKTVQLEPENETDFAFEESLFKGLKVTKG